MQKMFEDNEWMREDDVINALWTLADQQAGRFLPGEKFEPLQEGLAVLRRNWEKTDAHQVHAD